MRKLGHFFSSLVSLCTSAKARSVCAQMCPQSHKSRRPSFRKPIKRQRIRVPADITRRPQTPTEKETFFCLPSGHLTGALHVAICSRHVQRPLYDQLFYCANKKTEKPRRECVYEPASASR